VLQIGEVCPISVQVWDHWGAMVLAARPVVGTLDEARDCASQAIVQYLEQDRREVANLEAFMVTIAKRRAIDLVRARERARLRDERYGHEAVLSAPDLAEDVATRAEALWADREARRLLQPKVYELLTLVADGVPMAEVAQRLGMTERAAQSHLLRARRVVRNALARALAALGIAVASLRRWWGPAAATAPVLAAAFVLAIGTATAPPVPAPPALTLLPGTTSLPHVEVAADQAHRDAAHRRAGSIAARTATRAPSRPRDDVHVRTPVGSVSVEDRDTGHDSDSYAEELLWCVQHVRIELHYQGCDTETADGSAEQRPGEATRDRPLVPPAG
jgi:DNA-directed RNA polymerase specialized sigma24 family protein